MHTLDIKADHSPCARYASQVKYEMLVSLSIWRNWNKWHGKNIDVQFSVRNVVTCMAKPATVLHTVHGHCRKNWTNDNNKYVMRTEHCRRRCAVDHFLFHHLQIKHQSDDAGRDSACFRAIANVIDSNGPTERTNRRCRLFFPNPNFNEMLWICARARALYSVKASFLIMN